MFIAQEIIDFIYKSVAETAKESAQAIIAKKESV